MKKLICELFLKFLKRTAINSAFCASIFGMGQPKEPKSLTDL